MIAREHCRSGEEVGSGVGTALEPSRSSSGNERLDDSITSIEEGVRGEGEVKNKDGEEDKQERRGDSSSENIVHSHDPRGYLNFPFLD